MDELGEYLKAKEKQRFFDYLDERILNSKYKDDLERIKAKLLVFLDD